jgi:cell filamentation protein
VNKISIRFFDDPEVRAVWDDENDKYLKAKLKREGNQVGSVTTQFK